MKKTIYKLKDWVLFWIWFLIIIWIANAWTDITQVSTWEPLTATIWNELLTKLNDTGQRASWLFTDINSNVWVWTSTPISKFEVSWNIATKWWQVLMQRPVTTWWRARGLMYTPDWVADPTYNWLAWIWLAWTASTEGRIFLTFWTSPWTSTAWIQILPNWNVWIWTYTPTSTLDVNWTINVSWQPLSKTFYIRSSDANVKCINVNYAPAWYTDDECIWQFSWYAFYEAKSQDTFTTYTDSTCTTVYESRWLNNVKFDDKINTNHYMKIPVVTWFYSELFCQKWMAQAQILY